MRSVTRRCASGVTSSGRPRDIGTDQCTTPPAAADLHCSPSAPVAVTAIQHCGAGLGPQGCVRAGSDSHRGLGREGTPPDSMVGKSASGRTFPLCPRPPPPFDCAATTGARLLPVRALGAPQHQPPRFCPHVVTSRWDRGRRPASCVRGRACRGGPVFLDRPSRRARRQCGPGWRCVVRNSPYLARRSSVLMRGALSALIAGRRGGSR